MIKNDLKFNLLFVFLAFLVASCSVNKRDVIRKSPTASSKNKVRKGIVAHAKKQIGVKYVYGGKTPKGFDCSGFTRYVFKKEGVELSGSSKIQAKQGKSVNIKWAKKGDLLFFGEGGKISHVSLIVENNKEGIQVIHSTSSRGVIRENISKSSYWKKKMLFARNIVGN